MFSGNGDERLLVCRHCGHEIGEAGGDYAKYLPCHVGQPTEAGPRIWSDASAYIDQDVVFRQYYCPGCYVAVRTEVVPANHPRIWDQVATKPESP